MNVNTSWKHILYFIKHHNMKTYWGSGCIAAYSLTLAKVLYESVSKSFRAGRLEREQQIVQLSATGCSCIAILWVSVVSIAAISLFVAYQRVFIVVRVYFVIGSVRKLVDTPSYDFGIGKCYGNFELDFFNHELVLSYLIFPLFKYTVHPMLCVVCCSEWHGSCRSNRQAANFGLFGGRL
jgi:hypothetical protein